MGCTSKASVAEGFGRKNVIDKHSLNVITKSLFIPALRAFALF
jgi:hypothetical protein